MRIRWTDPAVRSFAEHLTSIATENLDAAQQVRSAVVEAVYRLTNSPHRGRPGKQVGTRDLVIARFPTYIVIYRVTEAEIRILHVWHRRQNRN